MAVVNHQYSQESISGDALKHFQLSTDSVADKSSKEHGEAIAKKINGTISGNLGNYYASRNARFQKNRNYANGRIDIETMFKDRLRMNAKQNYIRLSWQTLQIVNRIVSGLVGRWMQRSEKIQVKATDDLSQSDKQDQYEQIEFILHNREKLEQLQQQSGVQLVPQDQFIPSDKEELNLWQAQFQRLPEEILYELGCNDIMASNGCYDVLKEKWLHDSAEVGMVAGETWMDSEGVVHTDWIKPENTIYSYTEYPDFRDTAWRGQMISRKISDIRKRYGKEFNPNNPFALDEEKLFYVAQKAKEYQYNQNLTWDMSYVSQLLRPYDEWNVRCLEFEIKTVDSDPYTVTKTVFGSTYTDKGYPVNKKGERKSTPSPNQKILSDTNWNIYRCAYIPDCNYLVEWKLKDNMIRPQDPREIGNAEFSYSFYMYQPFQMRNLAIPEKIEAAVDGMILALLKMQQVVARMRPTGAAVNTDALQNIDYGLGNAGNDAVDYKKLFDQTGDIYYKGRDAEGNPIPIPITELANSGFLGQMDGLIKNYQFNYQSLKDELGEDPNLISAALQPRVTAQNVEASQSQAEVATDYMYRAYAEFMKITARKVSCLLKDSVVYGAQAYRQLVNADDLGDRIFSTDIRFLPTDVEVQNFQIMMQQAMTSTPELVLFIDPFQMMRVAKEDVKLAELLYRNGQKKMILHQQQMQQQNQQATIQGQIQSAQASEQAKGENMQFELQKKGEFAEQQGKVDKEKIVLQGVFDLAKQMLVPTPVNADGKAGKREPLPPSLSQLMDLAIKNIAIPLAMDNAMLMSGGQPQNQPQPQQDQEEMQEQQDPQQQNQLPQQQQVAA
jgi:hypothetical protein